ncbi:GAF domain-containing sensor histidine kinase [Cytobacillus oceanisediminis]|uniref:GAF domain-containing sensor histidine kinase n=1 Tax=Cytobacillus oceanisediminis TaxID=665099 RepID=UPI001D145AB5|nr:GAF domain-containing sensor histidine kinase [Cytobacillus oceanisediminis]MCC3646707.1 GAF domain-containing sensor histidine kinase [Cytobacillus oceanisediminis]
MKKIDSITRRERIASFYIYSISFLGVIAVIFSIFKSEMPSEPITLLLLAVFMGITEYFPIRIGRGGVTLSLTLIYPMSWEFGIHITVVACVCAMVFTHTLRRLPMQRTLFNCTQFAFSIILAEWVSNKCISFFTEMNLPVLYEELISFLIFTIFFCLINTLLYDFLMVLLPQPYSLEQWYKKNILLLLSGSFCLIYASLIYILEHRYRGELDGVTVLFFFFPLVAICILSSFIRQIRIEKERLYNLFSVTTELSHGLSSRNLHQMKQTLQGFMGIQAYALWTKEEGDWMLLLKDGKVHSNRSSSSNPNFEEISETFVVAERKTGMAPGDEIFEDVIRSLVYLPLKVNHELVGMFVAGKSRGASFIPEDIQSLSTFANQLGSLLKTRSLVSEQEKRMILEERNRLAREIHDGIAQVLAGVIFQLESSLRQSADQSGSMEQAVDKSIKKLRNSLGEVRYSIYALKPYPTQRLGLKQAIANKIQSIKQDYDLAIKYHERGRSRTLSFTKERVIFDTLQESLQNIVKHAKAGEVDILLSYQREHVLLKVKDNGVGFSLFESMIKTKHEPHYGILNMNEQAEQLGATLQIDSSIGKGTEITLLIPDLETKEGYHDSSIISG